MDILNTWTKPEEELCRRTTLMNDMNYRLNISLFSKYFLTNIK